jgi:hypothetical protein
MDSSCTRPTTWDAARDEAFFRIVQYAFPPVLLEAAGVLLASYDDAAPVADRRSGPPTTDRRSCRRLPAWPLPRLG